MLTSKQVFAKNLPRLQGLHPTVKAAVIKWIANCYKRKICVLVIEGYRSKVEQNQLYAQGRTKPGPIVTYAKGGSSYHNYGLAIDFALLSPNGDKVLWDTKIDQDKDRKADWQEAIEEAKKLGFQSGAEFKKLKDMGHLQMNFGQSITALKKKKAIK